MSEALLLDTCAAIWITEGAVVADEAMDAIDRAYAQGAAIGISPITAWEVGLLVSKGRLTLRSKPHSWYRALTNLPGVSVVELTGDILIDVSFLPGRIHGDPADRIIVATARFHDMTILTRDKAVLRYAQDGHVRAIAC